MQVLPMWMDGWMGLWGLLLKSLERFPEWAHPPPGVSSSSWGGNRMMCGLSIELLKILVNANDVICPDGGRAHTPVRAL